MPIGVPITAQDINRLARITHLEARPNPEARDLMVVAEVVLNRVADTNGYFAESVSGVLSADQFEPIANGKFANKEPTEAELATTVALIDALGDPRFASLRTGGTFFENKAITEARGTGLTANLSEDAVQDVTLYKEDPRFPEDSATTVYGNDIYDSLFNRESEPLPRWELLYSDQASKLAEKLRNHPAYERTVDALIQEYSPIPAREQAQEARSTDGTQPSHLQALIQKEEFSGMAFPTDTSPDQEMTIAATTPDARMPGDNSPNR